MAKAQVQNDLKLKSKKELQTTFHCLWCNAYMEFYVSVPFVKDGKKFVKSVYKCPLCGSGHTEVDPF